MKISLHSKLYLHSTTYSKQINLSCVMHMKQMNWARLVGRLEINSTFNTI